MDLNALYPFIITIAGVAISVSVIYFLWARPRMTNPLPDTPAKGNLQIDLAEFGVQSGPYCSGLFHFQRLMSMMISLVTDENTRNLMIIAKEECAKFYPIAHRVEGKVNFYFFTQNPEGAPFWSVDPEHDNSWIMGKGIEDVHSLGEHEGHRWYGIKLGPETEPFTESGRNYTGALIQCYLHVRDGAKNLTKMIQLKTERDMFKEHLDKSLQEMAKLRSENDRAKSALAQKNLSVDEKAVVPGALKEVVKSWFGSPWQYVAALIGYFAISPLVSEWLKNSQGIVLPYPNSAVLAALVTAGCFFAIPLGRKLFGRWL